MVNYLAPYVVIKSVHNIVTPLVQKLLIINNGLFSKNKATSIPILKNRSTIILTTHFPFLRNKAISSFYQVTSTVPLVKIPPAWIDYSLSTVSLILFNIITVPINVQPMLMAVNVLTTFLSVMLFFQPSSNLAFFRLTASPILTIVLYLLISILGYPLATPLQILLPLLIDVSSATIFLEKKSTYLISSNFYLGIMYSHASNYSNRPVWLTRIPLPYVNPLIETSHDL